MFENIVADIKCIGGGKVTLRALVRGLLSQGFQAILVYRFFRWLRVNKIPGQPFRFLFERFIEITTGISIPAECSIGRGFRIHHFGGIFFHPAVKIGKNCSIYQDVTIGDRGGHGGAATVGDNVLIGAGAKIIGEITIGNNCIIGANSVVTKDMPDNTVAIGNPCQIKKRKDAVTDNNKENSILKIMDLRGTYKGGGGPDKTILNSAHQHDRKRVDVLVTYLRDPRDEEFSIHEKAAGLDVDYIDVPDRKVLDLKCVSQLSRIIKKDGIELLHAHDDKTLLYGWLLKMLNPGLVLMCTCHSHSCYTRDDFTNSKDWYKYVIREKIQIFLMNRYKKPILTISEDTKRRLAKNGIDSEGIEVIYNGIDIDYWKKAKGRPVLRKEEKLKKEGVIVGTVARITYDKDLPTFYKVAEKVAKEVPGALFLIVGDGHGDELAKAREEVEKLGLSDIVKFTGHRNDLLHIYRSFDLFLMTSLTEGLPNTVLEAMAMEVPVISTAIGGVPELVLDGKTGFLAPKGDVDALSGHIIKLLKDPSLREDFAHAGRKRIEDQFSFAARVTKMEDYYEAFVD